MKTNNHTPGPWTYGNGIVVNKGAYAHVICDYGASMSVNHATGEANARLIASSPLMFECLELIEGAMAQAKEIRGTDRYSLEFTASALNGIRAAIAAATGSEVTK